MTTEPRTQEVAEEHGPADRMQEASGRFLTLMESLDSYGLTFSDLLLGLDTVGYERVDGNRMDMRDLSPPERTMTVRRSRVFWQREPLVDRSIRMWTELTFASPWSVQAKEDAFQAVIDEVLEAAHNRRLFNRGGWKRSSNTLLVDGERWFAFFVGDDRISVRGFDTLEMVEVLSNPEDRDEPWYYIRRWTDTQNKTHVWVYRDWDFVDDSGNPRSDGHPLLERDRWPGDDVDLVPQADTFVTKVDINTLGQRGYPLFTSGLDWVRAHREFLRDRSALTSARAQYFAKGKAKGGQSVVNSLKDALEGPDPAHISTDGLRRPRAGAFVSNMGADLEDPNWSQDGASARNDERALRLMALIPAGVPEHLIGDISTGNLATADALKGPLEKMFQSYQGEWMDFLEDLCQHITQWRRFTGDTTVDIDAPPIFERDLVQMASVVSSIVNAFPVVKRSTEVLSLILTELGLNNVDEVIDFLEPFMDDERLEPEQQAAVEEAMRLVREVREAERGR